ncbi:MAG: hypothetical protein AAFV88_12070, partial [Planctomycetota bacterium]
NQKRLDELNQRRIESGVRMYVAQMGRLVPLMSDQREKLEELFREQMDGIVLPMGQTGVLLCSYRCTRVPTDSLEAILDDNQLRATKKMFGFAKQYRQMLIAQGAMDEDDE